MLLIRARGLGRWCLVLVAVAVGMAPIANSRELTYHGDVSRIVNQHCASCHHEGGVGPFPLDSYEDLVAHAAMVREVVVREIMPPWFAADTEDGQPSPWENDNSLTAAERQTLIDWIDNGRVEGDAAGAAPAPSYDESWKIGQPDAIFEFRQAVPVQATGVMPYKHIVINTSFPQDMWVQAAEVVPGNAAVVHHALVFLGEAGRSVESSVNYWAGYAPGNGARTYPDGYARRLPRGAKLVFQMHYTPNGTATRDKTKIGFRFAKQPPQFEVGTASVLNTRFAIPPRAKDFQVEAQLRLPRTVRVLGFLAHHHLRGAAGRYELLAPSGETQRLLDIPDYDFNWQLFYRYADPPELKRGSRIRYTAWYDNSAENPANPNPNVTVRWGPQTHHEMHIGYVEYAVPINGS